MFHIWKVRTSAWLCILVSTGAHAGDPQSQAEIDHLYPLPAQFGPFDLFSAKILAKQGAKVLSATLLDSRHARFQNVTARLQADWRSWDRDYYICGEINAPNGMGGYTGWEHFVISENPKGAPKIFFAQNTGGELMYQVLCTRGREDRFVSDASMNYGKILAGR